MSLLRIPALPRLSVLAAGLALLLAPAILQAQSAAQAVILQYHHVGSATPPVTSISTEDLRKHLEFLRDEGFSVLRLEEVLQALRTGAALPERSAVLSFDDGYRSVYDEAWPLLQEFGYPFTIFVTAGLVTSNGRLYASWEQLREMGAAGATLANHTMSHAYMVERAANESEAEWRQRMRSEIEDAEALIAAETGQSHKLLAWPYGEYDAALQALVQELGYIGIGQHSGPVNASSDFTALPRFPVSGIYASMRTFPTKAKSLAFDVELVAPGDSVTAESSPVAELRFAQDYRFDALNCFNADQPMKIEVVDAASRHFRISSSVRNEARRFRYNCTAPGPEGRFYWYSVTFLNPARADY